MDLGAQTQFELVRCAENQIEREIVGRGEKRKALRLAKLREAQKAIRGVLFRVKREEVFKSSIRRSDRRLNIRYHKGSMKIHDSFVDMNDEIERITWEEREARANELRRNAKRTWKRSYKKVGSYLQEIAKRPGIFFVGYKSTIPE